MIQLGYFTLDTPDIDKARAFYSATLGWRFDEAASKPTYAHVADSNPPFGLCKGERKDFPHLYFRVEDIEAVRRRIIERGGQAGLASESESGLSAVVSDDQGVSFSLWQAAEGF